MGMKFWAIYRLMTARYLSERFTGNFLGGLWIIIVPLMQLAIYGFVFVEIFKARVPEADTVGFLPFLAVAFWPWLAFAEGAQRASSALLENRDLLGKIAMPLEVLPAAVLSSAFILHLLGYGAVLLVLSLTGTQFVWSGLPVVLLTLCTLFLFALALAWVLAVLQVYFKDIAHLLGPLFMLWFFATPILYSSSLIPEQFRPYALLNPIYHLVHRIREAMIHGVVLPDLMDGIWFLGALCVAWLSLYLFRRCSRRLQDFL